MRILSILIVILILSSCKSQTNPLIEFDPRTIEGHKTTLAEIADDIEYIPFDNSLSLGNFYMYKLLDSNIYISTREQGIIVFSRNGKFIRKIGAQGRGPGEYHYCMNFDADPKSKSVYVLDGIIIKVYNGSGQFQRSISLKDYDWRFDNITFYNKKLFVSEAIYQGRAKYSWLILDTNGVLLSKKYNSIPTFDSNLPSDVGTYIFNDNLFYWEQYNDTVFSMLPDLTYEPALLLSAGEHRFPKSRFPINPSNLEPFIQFLKTHLQIRLIFETERFLIIRYYYMIPTIALIEKESQKTYLFKMVPDEVNGTNVGGIINDLDAGIMFQPEYYYVDNNLEYIITLAYPSQIKDRVTSNDFLTTIPKYPDKKQELIKLANSLKETDNQVLMMVRLKEQ